VCRGKFVSVLDGLRNIPFTRSQFVVIISFFSFWVRRSISQFVGATPVVAQKQDRHGGLPYIANIKKQKLSHDYYDPSLTSFPQQGDIVQQ
jgi:hypothetical protein